MKLKKDPSKDLKRKKASEWFKKKILEEKKEQERIQKEFEEFKQGKRKFITLD